MTICDRAYKGISFAEDLVKVWNMWIQLQNQNLCNANSIRVFDGCIYSLVDDDTFYEEYGLRKKINVVLFCWDALRDLAMSDHDDPQNNLIHRDEGDLEEQEKLDDLIKQFTGALSQLIVADKQRKQD